METFIESESPFRLLGLGNDILADDAFGLLVAREAARRFGGQIDVVCSSAAGFDLLDHLLGAAHLLVADTVTTGSAEPGTIEVFEIGSDQPVASGSPHFLGLFEVLALGKALQLPVPGRVTIIAMEAADCSTVGGDMHPAVQRGVSRAVDLIARFLNYPAAPDP